MAQRSTHSSYSARAFGLCLGIGFVLLGCTSKESLCRLSSSSEAVAKHYDEYVAKESDPGTKAAREAESKQFKKTIEETKQQCN
jgi:hypothetical protein